MRKLVAGLLVGLGVGLILPQSNATTAKPFIHVVPTFTSFCDGTNLTYILETLNGQVETDSFQVIPQAPECSNIAPNSPSSSLGLFVRKATVTP